MSRWINEWDDSIQAPAPCRPIGCDADMHLPGCYYAAVEQCPHCTSDRRDRRFVMPAGSDAVPCDNAWHDQAEAAAQ